MSDFRPSPTQERWLLVASRLRLRGQEVFLSERTGDWRTVSLVVRCALFALGIFAAAMVGGICDLIRLPHAALVAGLVLVIAAEWLIGQRRLFGAGIEEALELVGLALLAFDVHLSLGPSEDLQAALLVAALCAIAGLRLLNPLFTTLAAVALSFAIEIALSGHSLRRSSSEALLASLACFAIGLLALGFGALRLQRPTHDRMLDWLVLAMPLAGYLWAGGDRALSAADYLHDPSLAHLFAPLALVIFGVMALVVGIRRRTHAPLLAFAICIGCTAYELRNLTGVPIEARLIVWGSIALVVAVILDRYLRTPRDGITSQKLSDREGPLGLLQFAGAASLTPHTQPAEPPAFQGAGGHSGGGGASGSY